MLSATSNDRNFAGLVIDQGSLDVKESSHSIRSQVIVTEVQGQKVAFPSTWVEEVMLFPRQRVIKLPFYQMPILGIVPHQGDLVLLLAYQSDSPTDKQILGQQENIRAIRLGAQVGSLSGASILIDKIVGTVDNSEVEAQESLQLFSPDYISLDAFDPYRWI